MSLRKKFAFVFIGSAVLFAVRPTFAAWSVSNEGTWPKDWPEELEPLREQSRTLQGGLLNLTLYEIPFAKREDFEAAWPHILSIKTKGAPVILLRGPDDRLGTRINAGIRIQSPPQTEKPVPAEPLPGKRSVRQRWMGTTYIELVVDGSIVDLNRISLPADTPIVDERFEKRK